MRVMDRLHGEAWNLTLARAVAEEIAAHRSAVRALMGELFGEDIETRKRAADVARRITERDAGPLRPYADELAGQLAGLPVEESRTRWHLGLLVPRVADTRERRLRVARMMALLEQDASNLVRCSAVEGMGVLALAEPSLRDEADAMIERYLRAGSTKAMKSRARAVRKMLARGVRKSEEMVEPGMNCAVTHYQ